MINTNKILILAVIIAFLISILHIFFCIDVYDDIAAWYGPMVRAFAAGDWESAFTPEVPILNTTFAGLLSCLGVEPFQALMVISCMFYIASIPVLYYLLKFFLKREDYAAWGCVLYVVAPKIIRFSCTGLLNSAKNFFIISALALILASSKRLKWYNSVLLGIVLAGLALARAETVVFIPFLVLWYAYFIFRDKNIRLNRRFGRIFIHCLVITVTFFIVASPRLYQTYKIVGVPVTDSRQASCVANVVYSRTPDFVIRADCKTELKNTKYPSGWTRIYRGLECFMRGAYQPYLFLALLGIFLWWRKKENRAEAFMLFSVILINVAVIIIIVNSVRYYTITLMMLLPFTFIGIKYLVDLLPDKKFIKPLLIAGFAVIAVLQIRNGAAKLIEHEYDYEYKTGKWIQANKKLYSAEKMIKVASTQPQYSFWANGVWLDVSENKTQFSEQLEQIRQAQFVVLERDQQELIAIIKAHKDFELLEQENPEVLIFAVSKGEQK